jgi:hypothetical protein
LRSEWWILLFVMFFMIAPVFAGLEGVCWNQESYGRGVGTVPTQCPDGEVYDAGLCYPACKEGYTGVGPVCWEKCPTGYTNLGLTCGGDLDIDLKKSYGRGVGSLIKKTGWEKQGLLWYKPCKEGYEGVGPVCWEKCPKGYTDDGVACGKGFFFKDSYGRGVGTVPKACKGGKEYDAGLCYKACKEGYKGVGPVCWGSCPADMPVNCGAACAITSNYCIYAISNWIYQPIDVSANAVLAVMTMGTSLGVKTAARSGMRLSEVIAKKAKNYAEDMVEKKADQLRRTQEGMLCGNELFAQAGGKDKFKASVVNDLTKEAKSRGKEVDPDELNKAADRIVEIANNCEVSFDYKSILIGLDPTGIAELVDTFACKKCKGSKSPTTCPPGMCKAHEVCVDGRCVSQTECPQGTFSCGNDCCNMANEKCANSQCLPKDNLCPPGMCKAHEVCVDGRCVSQTECLQGTFSCGNDCCPAGASCLDGKCVSLIDSSWEDSASSWDSESDWGTSDQGGYA